MGITRATTRPSGRVRTPPGMRGTPVLMIPSSASRWRRTPRRKMYGPTMVSSAASGPAGSRPSCSEPRRVQRSIKGRVARSTSSSSSRLRSGLVRTQASAIARSSATASSQTARGVASGTGSRDTYWYGPPGITREGWGWTAVMAHLP